jgi:hypothetical protein
MLRFGRPEGVFPEYRTNFMDDPFLHDSFEDEINDLMTIAFGGFFVEPRVKNYRNRICLLIVF